MHPALATVMPKGSLHAKQLLKLLQVAHLVEQLKQDPEAFKTPTE